MCLCFVNMKPEVGSFLLGAVSRLHLHLRNFFGSLARNAPPLLAALACLNTQVAYRLKHMKAELEAKEKKRKELKAAAAAAALAANEPIPESPKKTRGLPGNSTSFPVSAVPWP